jgi:hypothetical protein
LPFHFHILPLPLLQYYYAIHTILHTLLLATYIIIHYYWLLPLPYYYYCHYIHTYIHYIHTQYCHCYIIPLYIHCTLHTYILHYYYIHTYYCIHTYYLLLLLVITYIHTLHIAIIAIL